MRGGSSGIRDSWIDRWRWFFFARAQLTTDESATSAPEPPKRAMTAYLIFCQRHREKIMRSIRPDASQKFTRDEMQQVTTKLAALWNNISAKELKEVKEEAAKCKAEYEMQKAAFPSALLKKLARAKNKPKGTIVVEAQGEKPVRAKTAYLIFCGRHREKIMRGIHADPDAKFTRAEMQQVTTQLAALWKNIGDRELAECKAEAAKELERYRELKANYRPAVYGPAKKPKGAKGVNKPKKAPTAYLLFAEDLRNKLKESDPELKHDVISQRLSHDWKNISPTDKLMWQRKADEQKVDLSQHGMLPATNSLAEHGSMPILAPQRYDLPFD